PSAATGLVGAADRVQPESGASGAEAGAPAPPPVPAAQPGVLLPEASAAALGPGHRVQLGVFGDAANALAVYERAVEAGYDARIQSRVVVGPFADKAAAERAQRKLREAGLGAGVILPPARSN
ncbi:MAG: SPOR domain-containing protein, partial [Thauera sp.]